MKPTDKELLELGRGREGSLAKTPFPVLLQALYVAERTGVLELKQKNLEKRIALEDGVPASCDSNLLHETPARFLCEKGRITEEQYQKALTEAAIAGERIEQTLLRLQFVSPFELFKLLQQNLAYKILDCFCQPWADAKYRILAEPPELAQPLPMNLPQLVYTGVTTFAPFGTIEANAAELRSRPLGLVPQPPHELKALKLGARDARMLQLLKARPTLDALAVELRLSVEDVLRRTWALHLLGYVDFAERIRETAEPAPVVVLPSPTPPAATDTPADVEALKNEVMAAYLRYRGQDPFDLFGLPENAPALAMRDAFLSWSEKFAPWRFASPELLPLQEKARDLFTFGARAFAQLADTEQRTLVLRRREAAREAAKRKKATDFSIKTDLLDARTQHEEGMRRLRAGQAAAAIPFLEFAADCEPRSASFRSHVAWARFLADPKGNARAAVAELDEAYRIDPTCGEALFLAGEIYRWGNDLTRAEEAYRRATKLMPGDRRPVEALRDVMTAAKARQ